VIKLNVFDRARPVAVTSIPPPPHLSNDRAAPDAVIVPAPQEGFERLYMREHAWHAIRIGGAMLDKIKYCAA
jgi:hypothetical protein